MVERALGAPFATPPPRCSYDVDAAPAATPVSSGVFVPVFVLVVSLLVVDPRSSRSVPPVAGEAISLEDRAWVDDVVASG